MERLNFSLNNISLMGMTLAVGFVVDDAIVMLENVVRHLERGEKPMRAAFSGSREIGFTVLSMTISLVAVFIPLLFMGDLIGRMFKEFAVTITCAIVVSGAVSLTLTPMLCGRFLRVGGPAAAPAGAKVRKITMSLERMFDAWLRLYQRSLRVVLRHSRLTMLFLLAAAFATLLTFIHMPKGFFPSEDTGQISGNIEAAQGTSFAAMSAYQALVTGIIQQDPDIRYTMCMVGAAGPNASLNTGTLMMRLTDRRIRSRHVD
jgi:HAE1 family hydrophobic/amphiphilic exporter-1